MTSCYSFSPTATGFTAIGTRLPTTSRCIPVDASTSHQALSPSSPSSSSSCDASVLDWASLILTFITAQVTWWLLETPLLRKKGGLRLFIERVVWNCVRLHQPSAAGIIAFARTGGGGQGQNEVPEWARTYYFGPRRRRRRRQQRQGVAAPPPEEEEVEVEVMTRFKLVTALAADSFVLVSTGTTLYQACAHTDGGRQSRSAYALFMFPSLPVALIGLSLLLGQRLRLRGGFLLCLIVLVLLLVGTAVALLLWRFGSDDDPGGLPWFLSLIVYAYMVVPLGICNHLGLALVVNFLSMFARVGGVGFAALSNRSDFPYCGLKNTAFGATYLALGGLAALFSVIGAVYYDRPQEV